MYIIEVYIRVHVHSPVQCGMYIGGHCGIPYIVDSVQCGEVQSIDCNVSVVHCRNLN